MELNNEEIKVLERILPKNTVIEKITFLDKGFFGSGGHNDNYVDSYKKFNITLRVSHKELKHPIKRKEVLTIRYDWNTPKDASLIDNII